MLTTFAVWAATGLSLRTTLSHALRLKWRYRLAIPQSLAGAAIYTTGALSLLPVAPSLIPVTSARGRCWLDGLMIRA